MARADHRQTQTVGDGIGQEVECVGLEGLRASELSRRHFGHEHRAIDRDHRPQDTLVARVYTVEDRDTLRTANILDGAACRHLDGWCDCFRGHDQRWRSATGGLGLAAVLRHG
ncbi:hypothetical protein M2305_003102 [Gluconobacter cerinus]|nr:hypothetical protein [Gluconobacter cerinus]